MSHSFGSKSEICYVLCRTEERVRQITTLVRQEVDCVRSRTEEAQAQLSEWMQSHREQSAIKCRYAQTYLIWPEESFACKLAVIVRRQRTPI